MKKTRNINKKGFTLTEAVLVVAIIIIVTGAFGVGIAQTLGEARAKEERTAAHIAMYDSPALEADIKGGLLISSSSDLEAWEGMVSEDHTGYTGSSSGFTGGSTGGGLPTPTPMPVTPIPTATPQPQATATPVPTATATPAPTATTAPANPSAGGSVSEEPAGGSGTVTFKGNKVAKGTSAAGVVSFTENADGSYSVVVTQGWNNDCSVKIIPQGGGKYNVQVDTNMQWVIGSFPGLTWDGTNTYKNINSDQKNWFKNTYGIELN